MKKYMRDLFPTTEEEQANHLTRMVLIEKTDLSKHNCKIVNKYYFEIENRKLLNKKLNEELKRDAQIAYGDKWKGFV